jgi:hypothetical protein
VRELDVHGLTVDQALKAFADFYNHSLGTHPQEPIRIVHGYGSSGDGGRIRLKIREFLESAKECLDWKTGEDAEANLGVTIVFPRKALRAGENQLAAAIVQFCSSPRTESKISAEFYKYEARKIKQAIRTLVRQNKLKEVFKGGHAAYVRA